MALRLGADTPAKAYVDGAAVSKLYLGSSLVADYSAAPARAFIRDQAVSYHSSATANASQEVVNRPANVVAGDLLLLLTFADLGAITAYTPPTGFAAPTGTAEAVAASGLVMLSVAQKVATSSEPSSYTLQAYATTANGFSVLYAIGNVGAATDVRVNIANSASSSTQHTSPTVTPVTAKGLNLRGIAMDKTTGAGSWTPGTAPAGYTLERSDTDPAGFTWAAAWRRDYDSVTATGTQVFPFTNNPVGAGQGLGWNIIIPSA